MGDSSDKSELDEYGVWIKTPLRNTDSETDSAAEASDSDLGLPDFSFLDDIARSDERMSKEAENIVVPEEEPAEETSTESSLDEFSSDDFMIESPTESVSNEEISADDFSTDDFITDPAEESVPDEEISADDFNTDDFSADVSEESVTNEEISADDFMTDTTADTASDGDISVDDFLSDTSDTVTTEDTPDGEISVDDFMTESSDEVSRNEMPDGEISVDDFMSDTPADSTPDGEISVDDFLSDSDSTPDGEISVDDFLSDSGDGPSHEDGDVDLGEFLSGGDGEISLDAFFGEGHEETKAQEETVVDEEPLDIDLTFDDTPVEQETDVTYGSSFEANFNAPDSDSSGSTDIDLDAFLSDDTPVDAAPKEEAGTSSAPASNETEEVSLDDFDSMFDSVQDEAPVQETEKTETSVSQDNEEIDLSEFGIEEDSDNQNVTIGKSSSSAPVQRDYEMNVSMDDETTSTTQTETTSEGDDENISLEVQPEEKIEKSDKKDTDFSAPDDDFDVDSLLNSVEYDSDTKTEETVAEESFDIPEEPVVKEETISEESFDIPEEPVVQEETISEESFDIPEEPVVQEETISEESFDIPEEPVVQEETAAEEETGEIDVTSMFEDTPTPQEETEEESEKENPPLAEESSEDFSSAETEEISVDDMFSDTTETSDEDATRSTETETYSDEPLSFVDITSVEVQKEEIPEKTITEDIPDTFDEEAASLTMDTATESENSISGEPKTNDTTSTEGLEILKQISTELASLKSEIETLKTEFAELKDQGTTVKPEKKERPFTEPVEEQSASSLVRQMNGEPEVPDIPKKDDGFFDETEDDDTIALSGDELNNILNTAEFTHTSEEASVEEDVMDVPVMEEPVMEEPVAEEPVAEETVAEETSSEQTDIFGAAENLSPLPEHDIEESVANLNMNFAEEQLEEPTFDTIESEETSDEVTRDLPDEISVPKTDDELIVESSTQNIIESEVKESDDEVFDVVAPTLDALEESDSFNEDTPEPLTDDNIDYLSSSVEEDDEELETGISEQPVESVFNKWENASEPSLEEEQPLEETLADSDVIDEPTVEETAFTEEPLDETAEEFEVPEVSVIEEEVNDKFAHDDEDLSVFLSGTGDAVLAAGLTEEQVQSVTAVEEEAEPVSEAAPEETFAEEPVVAPTEFCEEAPAEETMIEEPAETPAPQEVASDTQGIPSDMKQEIKSVLAYMDQLLESLPEEKITEFAQSEQFVTYKKLFAEFGLA